VEGMTSSTMGADHPAGLVGEREVRVRW
jgi:hypothetical protein